MAAGSTYTPIATTTLGSAQGSVSFSSISSSYTDLILVCSFKNSSTGDALMLRMNSDTGSNYSDTRLGGQGSVAGSGRSSNQSEMRVDGYSVGPTVTNNQTLILQFQNYANTSTYKTVLGRFSDAAGDVGAMVGLWRSTSAINQIALFNIVGADIAAGSTFTLYGITAA